MAEQSKVEDKGQAAAARASAKADDKSGGSESGGGRASVADRATRDDPAAVAAQQEFKPATAGDVLGDAEAAVDQSAAHEQRERFEAHRDAEHVGAREAAEKANEELARQTRELAENTGRAGDGAVANVPAEQMLNIQNQVPQEGALVETPPQPSPPPFPPGAEEHMDISPPGLREPSVAAKSDDTDQTVHPKSRVDDPRIPL